MSKSKTPRTTRPDIDWEAIERDYRTTHMSCAEIARKNGNVVTRQAIAKKAKDLGWERDLTDAVRAATKAAVIREEVKKRVDPAVDNLVDNGVDNRRQLTTDAVLVAAEIGAQVILRHRTDIRRGRDLTMAMLEELETAGVRQDELQDMFTMLSGDMTEEALVSARRRFEDLVRLPSRISSMHKLADTLAKLQAMERKAFSLDDDDGRSSTGDDIWTALAQEEQ